MTHMTDDLLQELRKKYDNPVYYFVDYPITVVTEDDEKRLAKMTKEQKEAWEQIPEDCRIQIKPEYAGLVNCLSVASDLAYDIANNIPENDHKMTAMILLDHLCKYLVNASKPTEQS